MQSSFKKSSYSKQTELAIYVWKLKNQGINENDICVKWNILDKIPAYHPSSKTCRLCIREIYRIIYSKNKTLNQNNEMFGKCRHRDKWKIERFVPM